MNYNGQVLQDKFILHVLKNKRNGTFIEIGSNHPITINNTYLLEKEYDWKGIMIEYDSSWLDLYKLHRPNSIHIINDATKINYDELFKNNNLPNNIDYLQIDLHIQKDNSTLQTLKKLNNEVFDNYKFATITFEHDIYDDFSYPKTRDLSRKIFEDRGYFRVFDDICNNNNPFEDWYVYPELVNMEYINYIKNINSNNYKYNKFTNKGLEYTDIIY